ncbi:psbP domain-containing protein 7, chloroplastic-like isoform X1 [Coffea arabica]|uniref:PsbP domain-containing protein 7, chloroplastic-like isoform X1 n=1 Tax=Coffea arabica TaxID=13443 RepID=A0A6P6WGS2_COFAR|nr:psbP domain-containing protein 7, chloroplastic-like isoform X1 [Coffea arabica]
MAIQMQHYSCLNACKIKTKFPYPICMTQSSNNDQKESLQQQAAVPPPADSANQFAPLASTFRRRLLTGVASASVVAVGANFAGITSFLLGLSPENARSLKLDVLYPIEGYSRCIEANQAFADQGFEFIYPANWVGDQTLLSRAAGKAERSLDPPGLKNGRKYVNEPIVAFGPPGSTGELNVSVIVSTVPSNFSIEAFGSPKEVGEELIKTITGKRPDVKGTLIQSYSREDSSKNVRYYSLEFQVESPTFQRHNVAVFCTKGGRLFTLNAQAPESLWPQIKSDLYTIADSFSLTS